jgi:Cu2+-exporting ATPase/Cu+-exporting ATPase
MNVFLLSGDNNVVVNQVANEVMIAKNHVFAEFLPDDKTNLIKFKDGTIMVGDGANDALALREADVGIAVKGSVEASLQVADVYITQEGIFPISKLFEISHETFKVIFRNLAFSVSYNLIAAILAIMGMITPLWAAVLMPISSFIVILSSILGTKKLRKL